jgi:hypothetical protein
MANQLFIILNNQTPKYEHKAADYGKLKNYHKQ